MGKIFGLDLSENNGNLSVDDFRAMKDAGVSFLILRTGYQETEDSLFRTYYQNAVEAGITNIGAYHYSYAKDPAAAKVEGQVCAKIISDAGVSLSLPVFYDCEENRLHGQATECTAAFIEGLGGLNAGVYASYSWFAAGEIDYEKLGIPIWNAEYNVEDDIKGFMWQFTDNAQIPGIYDKGFDGDYIYTQD